MNGVIQRDIVCLEYPVLHLSKGGGEVRIFERGLKHFGKDFRSGTFLNKFLEGEGVQIYIKYVKKVEITEACL